MRRRPVHDGLAETDRKYPFLASGPDWLAFRHLVIAIAFIGLLLDPVRNCWVTLLGVIACVGVLPLALIAGTCAVFPFTGGSAIAALASSAGLPCSFACARSGGSVQAG
jgi:hypothetical protein